jgi:hypothetical protein
MRELLENLVGIIMEAEDIAVSIYKYDEKTYEIVLSENKK